MGRKVASMTGDESPRKLPTPADVVSAADLNLDPSTRRHFRAMAEGLLDASGITPPERYEIVLYDGELQCIRHRVGTVDQARGYVTRGGKPVWLAAQG